MERDISVGLVKVDYLQSWSQIFQSDQTKMVRSINLMYQPKFPKLWVEWKAPLDMRTKAYKLLPVFLNSFIFAPKCLICKGTGRKHYRSQQVVKTVSQCIIYRANESMISLVVWTWFCSFNLLQSWQFSSQFEGKFIVQGLFILVRHAVSCVSRVSFSTVLHADGVSNTSVNCWLIVAGQSV